MHFRFLPAAILWWTICAVVSLRLDAAPRADGQLEIEVVDSATGQPIPARMHLMNARQRPVKLNLPDTAEFGGHFYIDGRLTLPLRRGQFSFEIDAGPEYRTQTGHFEIERHSDDAKRIEMTRFTQLAKEGWYAGDIDYDRRPRDVPLILRAEQLWDVRTAEFATLLQPGIEGLGPRTLKKRDAVSSVPDAQSPAPFHIAPTPYAWNLPVWLAADKLDAIQLIHGHSRRDGGADNAGEGRPRDTSLFPGHTGDSRWSLAIYYHVLNCGLRIPPVAGSSSGANDNPVGINRVYVHCGDGFTPEAWWQSLEEGRVFVTNGPLLRPSVDGQPPGHVFHFSGSGEPSRTSPSSTPVASAPPASPTEKGRSTRGPYESDDSLSLEIGLNLATRVPVDYLEIVKDGEVYAEVRLDEWKKKKGRLPPVQFNDSGWFLVRAITNNPKTFQYASSGPYYVQRAGRQRISRRSVQFFLNSIDAAEAHLRELPILDAAQRESLLAEQATAREFFEQLLATANAD
jgi:hypothetical protein